MLARGFGPPQEEPAPEAEALKAQWAARACCRNPVRVLPNPVCDARQTRGMIVADREQLPVPFRAPLYFTLFRAPSYFTITLLVRLMQLLILD